MVSYYSTNYKQDRYRFLFNKQIILISEKKKKCDIGLDLYLIVSFRFFKVTDMIGFTFALCENKLTSPRILYFQGQLLALVIGSVIPLALIFDKKCEKRSNTRLLID